MKPSKSQPPVDLKNEVVLRGPVVVSSTAGIVCKITTTYILAGRCERVFIQHPREELSVTQGSGMFFYPYPGDGTGAPAEPGSPGFPRIVEENVPYMFEVAEGHTLTVVSISSS